MIKIGKVYVWDEWVVNFVNKKKNFFSSLSVLIHKRKRNLVSVDVFWILF